MIDKELSALTPRARRFIQNYLDIDGGTYLNGVASALKAGYAKSSAKTRSHEIMIKPAVKAYLDKLMQSAEDQTIASLKELRQTWTKYTRGEMLGSEHKDRIKSSELLGKSINAFEDHAKSGAASIAIERTVVHVQRK